MKLFAVPKTALFVELMLRDEHCPPHVHVENKAVPWEARLAFSFVSDAVTLIDIDPVDEAPTARTIDRIKAAIAAHLRRCREAWWGRIGTCCLDNRWIRMIRAEVVVLTKWERGARQIRTASYDGGGMGNLLLIMKDGSTYAMKAGTGIEQ